MLNERQRDAKEAAAAIFAGPPPWQLVEERPITALAMLSAGVLE